MVTDSGCCVVVPRGVTVSAVNAAAAAFAMFLLGLLVVFGCLLGIFGKAVESVWMLRVFSLLTLLLSLLFLGFSCASFAQVRVVQPWVSCSRRCRCCVAVWHVTCCHRSCDRFHRAS